MNAAAAADVENAVRRHFESDDRETAGGPVLEFGAAFRALGLESQSETTIRSLTVVSVGENEAEVELDGGQESVSRDDRGRKQQRKANFTGPVRARREHGEWKVVDHCVDGRRISESFFSLGGDAVQVQGVSLRLNSVWLDRRRVFAFVEIENQGAEQAKIVSVSLAPKRCYCAGGQTHSEFAPGSSSTVMLGWRKSLPLRTRLLRLRVEVRTPGGQHVSVTWTIDLHGRRADGSVRKRGRLRVWLANPKVPWALAGLGSVAFVATIGIPPLSFFVNLGVWLGLVMAYVFVHPWLHGSR